LEEQRQIAQRLRAIDIRRKDERELLRKLKMLKVGLASDLLSGPSNVSAALVEVVS